MERLRGRTVLVLEDEPMVAMMIEDLLIDLGCNVLGPFSRVGEALAATETGAAVDLALLDVNVVGERSYPVAERLAAAGAPFIFVTAYDAAGVEPKWRDRPTLRKPFTQAEFEKVVREMLEG